MCWEYLLSNLLGTSSNAQKRKMKVLSTYWVYILWLCVIFQLKILTFSSKPLIRHYSQLEKNDLYRIITTGVYCYSLYKILIDQKGWILFMRFKEHTDEPAQQKNIIQEKNSSEIII